MATKADSIFMELRVKLSFVVMPLMINIIMALYNNNVTFKGCVFDELWSSKVCLDSVTFFMAFTSFAFLLFPLMHVIDRMIKKPRSRFEKNDRVLLSLSIGIGVGLGAFLLAFKLFAHPMGFFLSIIMLLAFILNKPFIQNIK